MDFLTFLAKKDEIEVSGKAGLYCIMQNHIPTHLQAARCGLAGKPVDSATQFKSAEGTFLSRFSQYANYFMPTSFSVYACLTVPRKTILGFTERVMPERVDGDNREDWARTHMGTTLIQIREKQYHALLTRFGMQRLGMPGTAEERKRGEFFRGDIRTCVKALRAIGTGDLYIFKGDRLDQIEKVPLKKRGLEALDAEQIKLRENPDRFARPGGPRDDEFSVTELTDEDGGGDGGLPPAGVVDTVIVNTATANRLASGETGVARAIERLRDVVPRRSPRVSGQEPIYVTVPPRTIERLARNDPQVRAAVTVLQQVRRRSPRFIQDDTQDIF